MNIFNKKQQDSTNNEIPDRVFIYESELDYISRCILDYPNIETGGNLFGSYTKNKIPIVEYVIGPGVHAVHEMARFQQEKEYLRNIYDYVAETFALSEIGAWHSHHQLDLPHPSGGDVRTVLNGLKDAELEEFIIVIGSFTPSHTPINAFVFENNPIKPYQSVEWHILKGVSPFRQKIDEAWGEILSHPNNLQGNYTEKQYHVFENQHWLSDKNNVEELKNIVNFIKQKTEKVKVFHPETDDIVIDIHSLDKNINIIFPSTFPSEPDYIIKISNNEGELINEIKDTINITDGISQSVIQNINNKNILV